MTAQIPDPITPLTDAEIIMVELINATLSREATLERLKNDLQTAIDIELATIPIYLFTYYSLYRNKNSGQQIQPTDLFANKAGGVIMSVAVEEMLHMTLSSNVLFSLGVQPQLYLRAPGPYPTGLPHHNPKGPPGPDGKTAVKIPLAKLGYEQLWHFLQIEYPETADAWPQDENWETIGQFYSFIRCLICSDHIIDEDFQQGSTATQSQDYNYSPNNIDTVHPVAEFDPWKPAPPSNQPEWADNNPQPAPVRVTKFSNEPDSHAGNSQLITVKSRIDALNAIDTICDQGEGNPTAQGASQYDDQSKTEDSHYYKFLTLQSQFIQYDNHKEKLAAFPVPPEAGLPGWEAEDLHDAGVLFDFPDNPVTAEYPIELQPLSNFCNGVFQYMLIMTETIYKVPGADQKLFFNEGLHRSMIWVLDKWIQLMRRITIQNGPYKGKILAPTFENIDLGERKDAFSNLMALGNAAAYAAQNTSYASNAAGIVAQTVSLTNDGQSMHLPDVKQYWK